MNYAQLEPPFQTRPFFEMTREEAQQFFDWYVEQIPSRLKQLTLAFHVTG